MFSYRSSGSTSLGTSPTRVRSTCFSLADSCCAGGAAVVVPAKQRTRKCELGVRFRVRCLAGTTTAAPPAQQLSAREKHVDRTRVGEVPKEVLPEERYENMIVRG